MNWYPWYGQSKEEICIDRRHYWKVNWVVHERHKFTISVEFSLILRSALYDIIKVKISNSKIFCTVGTKNANWQPQVSTIGVFWFFWILLWRRGWFPGQDCNRRWEGCNIRISIQKSSPNSGCRMTTPADWWSSNVF